MSHAINSHVLTRTNPCINKAIHVLLIHGYAVLSMSIPGPSQNLMSSSVNQHSSKRNFVTSSLALEAAFSKSSQVTCLSAPLYVQEKKLFEEFSTKFRVTKCFYAIIEIKHDFLIYLHLLAPSGGVETLVFQAL